MSDYSTYSVILLELSAGEGDFVYLTNSIDPVSYEGKDYLPMDGMEVSFPPVSSALDASECKIQNISFASYVFLTQLANHMPFSSVEVVIMDASVDADTGVVTSVSYPFKGLLYQAMPEPLKGKMSLICKGWKYYTDIVAGVPCTEQCSWQYLGGKGCGAEVHSENHTVDSVDGLSMAVNGPLADTTTLLFNKGYAELGGVRIKIKYHSSGLTFQMAKAPPADWVGKSVTLYAGCDRTLKTCRNIHNNEANFLGLGYAMVDYNALYESP